MTAKPLIDSIYTLYRDEYVEPIPEEERGDIILAYHPQLNSTDDEIRMASITLLHVTHKPTLS